MQGWLDIIGNIDNERICDISEWLAVRGAVRSENDIFKWLFDVGV